MARKAKPAPDTVGSVIRAHGGDVGAAATSERVLSIGFRQRTVISSLGTDDEAQDAVVVERTYHADIERDRQGRERSVIVATGLSSLPVLRLTLLSVGRQHWYSLDGIRHGRLEQAPHLFDSKSFASTIDSLPVVGIEEDDPSSVTLQMKLPDFTRLLSFTGSDPSASEELDSQTYGVNLDFSHGTQISYDWSLRGREEAEWDDDSAPAMGYRVSCSVTINVRAPGQPLVIDNPVPDPHLPPLRDVDDVWRAAREKDE